MSRVGIVIVTYNSEPDIGPCLDAALATGAEVIVVDNASTDGTADRVRSTRASLLANLENRGFAAAVNQGIRATSADLILLLNPDAVLRTGIEPLCEACAVPEVGVAGGKLVDADGSVQAGFNIRNLPTPTVLAFEVLGINRLWPSNPANWHYRCYGFDYNESGRVEQPAGAFLMFRREVWEKVGGFDERFFPIWFEDVDFCKRLRDYGYYSYYEPCVAATHRGGHSIQKILLEKREFYWYGSLLKYGFKHYQTGSSRVLCLAVMMGLVFRMAMGIVRQRSIEPIGVYNRVLRLAGRYLLFGPTDASPF